ncbi:MAG TPA: NAD(P)H-dependent oxidoreductase [Candidatus Cloacimonadota bacterium]|nr:NAD(P)H-dependent oxidoreductase [Candidatus Cloacimonadota bacterium]HQH49852.1 NAD(P)H-dependent oxidoreductase [Candidatus Cloacimonadota bacterium]
MNVLIVIHSHTGKTLGLAECAKDLLATQGHNVELVRLETVEPVDTRNPTKKKIITLANLPDINSADLLLLGGPVWAFRPSPVIMKAIEDLGGKLAGKKVIAFVTHAFPWAWLTGTSSMNAMRRAVGTLGAKVLPGFVLSGTNTVNADRFNKAAEQMLQVL